MKNLIVFALIVAVAILLEQTIERISPEALAMAIGVLFGILAGIPTALLMLASANKRPQPVTEQPRVEIHNHHYGQPVPPTAIDVVPHQVALAAQQRGGSPQYDGERWVIVDATGRRLATQRKQIAG